jgi:hypothetical protein
MKNKYTIFLTIFVVLLLVGGLVLSLFNWRDCESNALQGAATVEPEMIPLSEEEIAKIQDRDIWSEGELFNIFDRNRDGSLSYEEFRVVLAIVTEE